MNRRCYNINNEQFSVSINMPCIAWKATEEAAKEEAKIAYENGDVSKDGISMISVVIDGGGHSEIVQI